VRGRRRSRAQGLVEFIIVLPILLALVFGVFQFALLYRAKLTLNLATFEATRAGAVNNAEYEKIKYGLARSLAALYISTRLFHDGTAVTGAINSNFNSKVNAVANARDFVVDSIIGDNADNWTCIERINPTSSAFTDFTPSSSSSAPHIPNDNLPYRSGVPGSTSRMSIQDANLLKLRVTYCHPLVIPGAQWLLTALFTDDTGTLVPRSGFQSFRQKCYNDARWPLTSMGVIRMQTDAKPDTEFDNVNCE
jgi:Flp pilus assembly protein TadG